VAGWWLRVLPPIPEITLSFDNHVVKARVLCETDQNWQGVFLTIGILIAVFDLRLVFPILVVAVDTLENSKKTFTAHLYSVAVLAFEHPAKYARQLRKSNTGIVAFGGTFLIMVYFRSCSIPTGSPTGLVVKICGWLFCWRPSG